MHDAFLYSQREIDTQIFGGFEIEKFGKTVVDGIAHFADAFVGHFNDILNFVGQVPRHETQPPDPETQVMLTEKLDCLCGCTNTFCTGHRIEITCAQVGPDRRPQRMKMVGRTIRPCAPSGGNNVIDRACQFQMPIGLVAETGGDNRLVLCRLPPFLHPFGCGLGQKPCFAKHRFNRAFNLDPQAVDHVPHSLYPV